MSRPRGVARLVPVVLALALTGCASSAADDTTSSGGASSSSASGEINVFAAASLKESFETIKTDLQKRDPGLTINLQYGASGQLATQIQQGAPADVFASADETSMKTLTDAGIVGASTVFATNRLQIVVPKGNPGKVTKLADLADPKLTVVTCAEAAACGKTQKKIEAKAGITISSDSQEPDVKSVLQKVAMGEADAGLVYVTDVKSQPDKVEGIDFPEAAEFGNQYPIGIVKQAPDPAAAKVFVDYVTGEGQQALQTRGFGKP
ncbi:molybdate ABC transporter substrate-binding protein [Cumulibacter manganitolerans]|uniref:molybdate ABC transporter substrate-binding protein n=1 Tax=Cumulibacter manganitolerans TaxID=1884992 RepID=UPI0012980591|nr:molybdate ABC transporter substrate-binding protein [Cumulibacter manganitolerans]